ncbi:MAG: YtxH domain-containing protein [Bacteroidales bacterium]|nr:YtxH domain-containing protein [Bacteroidales bacterium]
MASKSFTFLAGAAIGAAVAVWLLNSEKGKEVLGKAADWADKALEKGTETAKAAKEKAGEMASEAKEKSADVAKIAKKHAARVARKAAKTFEELETELSK